MRIELITEMTHALHETYFMLRHYEWKRKGERHRTPMLVFMVDGVKDFYSGGMADRFKGMIASYAWCKQRDIEFRIRHIFPYELADYLEPSQYDWRLKEGEFTKCIWDSTLIYNRRVLGKRFVRKKLKRKQLHYYGNRDILHYINKTGKTNYTWGELFLELFQPRQELAEVIEKKKNEIGAPYISVAFRFQNLLGDFKEYDFQALGNENQCKEIIQKCIEGLKDLQNKYKGMPILVTSDSSTFVKIASSLPGIYVISGERVHMGCSADASYNTYLNSFVDFYMLAGSQLVFNLGTREMYPTKFPMYAAKVNDIPFERILLE